MITALAVETLLVSVLAWMSIQASVTLAAILTVTLIASAAVSELRSWTLSAMTLVAVLIIWRGEARKKSISAIRATIMELQQQQQKPISSNVEFDYPGQLVVWCRSSRLPQSPLPFLAGEFEEAY